MRYIIRSMISTFFYLLGLGGKREGVIVLMYHRVNDTLQPNDLVVPVARFREQMEYLAKNFDVISIDKIFGCLTSQVSRSKKKQILITFDDGYGDNYLNAYPILKELGLPATIFLVTGMTGTDKKRPRYKDMPAPDMLSWEEVAEMAQNGITFGAHTVSHPHLSKLSFDEQKNEIGGSIRTLVAPGSSHPAAQDIFCYPYGDYNADTLKILKELGVKIAFTIKPGINNEKTPALELRRTEISGIDTLFDFKKKLRGAFDIIHWLIYLRLWARRGLAQAQLP